MARFPVAEPYAVHSRNPVCDKVVVQFADASAAKGLHRGDHKQANASPLHMLATHASVNDDNKFRLHEIHGYLKSMADSCFEILTAWTPRMTKFKAST